MICLKKQCETENDKWDALQLSPFSTWVLLRVFSSLLTQFSNNIFSTYRQLAMVVLREGEYQGASLFDLSQPCVSSKRIDSLNNQIETLPSTDFNRCHCFIV